MLHEDTVTLELGGTAYLLHYNLNVMERVAEHFDGLDGLPKIFMGGTQGVKGQKWLLTAMINEGIDIQNDDGKNRPLITEKQVGRMVRTVDAWNTATASMLTAIGAAMPKEDAGKNGETTQGR